jgi:hypothetical protein
LLQFRFCAGAKFSSCCQAGEKYTHRIRIPLRSGAISPVTPCEQNRKYLCI